jgi:[protein-PII] uridylyltransferase
MHSYLTCTVAVKLWLRQSVSQGFGTDAWTAGGTIAGVIDSGDLPIESPAEVQAFLRDLPLALDRKFVDFVLGFPRKYLAGTPRTEIVKHYALMAGLGGRPVISSLAREAALWKLSLITRDRQFLFARIAGALSSAGMNIVAAEAFANASDVVLDTFRFADPDRRFDVDEERRRFQGFLEDAVVGKAELEPLLRPRLERLPGAPGETLDVRLDDESHPSATRIRLDCRDRFGLLYLVSREISRAGADIEMATVQTPGERVHDEFYVTREKRRLDHAAQRDLRARLTRLGDRYFGASADLL